MLLIHIFCRFCQLDNNELRNKWKQSYHAFLTILSDILITILVDEKFNLVASFLNVSRLEK